MLEAQVALLSVSLLLGQFDGEDDSAGEPAVTTSSTSTHSKLNYQFSQTNRVDIASGKTKVSAENGFVSPRSGYSMLRLFIDNSTGPKQTIELKYRVNGARGAQVVQHSVEVLEGERRHVVLPVMAGMRSGQVEARGPGLTEAGDMSVYFSTVYGSQQAMVAIGDAESTESFLHEKPTTSGADVTIGLIQVAEAPTDALSYMGLDVVLLPKVVTLSRLSEAQRAALESWVASGGRLMMPQSPTVKAAFPLVKEVKPGRNQYGFGQIQLTTGEEASDGWWADPRLPVSPWGEPPSYMRRSGGLGDVLLPQATAPIGRFLLIIFGFTLLIGPGSLWVARRRGPAALLITIPTTAFITCVIIVGYSAIADGFSVHGARYGHTILDRERNRAITVGVTGYYANLSPRDATFSASTGIIGAWEDGREPGSAGYVWANGQKFGADFLPSRTYREWGSISVEPTRARVTVASKGDGFVLRNALGADIDELTVNLKGHLYKCNRVADGAETTLQPATWTPSYATRGNARFSTEVTALLTTGPDENHFVARLNGAPFVPTGGLAMQMHKEESVVLGEVEP